MTEHYSRKIQNAIQKELFKANSSIKIAVAWFTNDLLFQPLLLKLGTGVSVELILNKDNINCSEDNDINFDDFVNAGGTLRWNETKQLLHDKFCIIDDNVVIYGSYNWTNKAEYNEESIAISKNESSTTQFYLEKFKALSEKYPIVEKKEFKEPIIKYQDKEFYDGIELVSWAIVTGYFPPGTSQEVVGLSLMAYAKKYGNFPSGEHKAEYECVPDPTMPYWGKLHFYDDINIYYGHLIAKSGEFFYFIDKENLIPINNVDFTNFSVVDIDQPSHLWLMRNGKWGLYDADRRKLATPIIFDTYKNERMGKFKVTIGDNFWHIDINGKIID